MDQRKQALNRQALKRALKRAAAGVALAVAAVAPALVSPAIAQIVIGGDGGSSVTVNLDVIDGRTGPHLTAPDGDGRILLMPNAPRESQQRIVLKPPASMRGARPAAPAIAAAPHLTAPSAPRVRPPAASQPEKPTAPKVATPKPADTPKPAAPATRPETQNSGTQRTAALPPAKPEPVRPPAAPAPAPRAESEPAPKAAPKATSKPAEQQVAALPPKESAPSQPAPAGVTRLSFSFNQAEMDQAAREQLQTIAQRLQGNESLRVQLLAYAGGEGMSSSQARRLSLSRALAVRSHLIEQGIRSTRMDVRALGDTGKDGPDDRVDIRIIDR